MQLFPSGWKPTDPPCYLVVGNWWNGADAGFISSQNVRLVVRAAGHQGNNDPAKPYEYPINSSTGEPPETIDCPVNNLNPLSQKIEGICKRRVRTWKFTNVGEKPCSVLAHCNEGINRGPALASIIAAKLMDCSPAYMAEQLSNYRDINPMYKEGKSKASKMGLVT